MFISIAKQSVNGKYDSPGKLSPLMVFELLNKNYLAALDWLPDRDKVLYFVDRTGFLPFQNNPMNSYHFIEGKTCFIAKKR